MSLETLWFILIAVLWTGFLVLEGFDFGVGMLHGIVGRDDVGRRVALGTIGPLWDGNEVWLIVAGAGMFAAFPGWYATMFSAYYLALVLLLVALIVRGVAFEFRGRHAGQRWRRTWDVGVTCASLLAPLLIGVALGDLLAGVPIGSDEEYAGGFVDLLTGYGLVTGATLVLLCLLHGATFLTLKTAGDIRERAARAGRRVAPLTTAVLLVWVAWTLVSSDAGALTTVIGVAAVLSGAAGWWLLTRSRDGLAFAATAVAIASVTVSIFAALYPRVMVSSLGAANDLTVNNTASASYTLTVMTVVAAVLLPLVLAYQAWTYYVFRRRLTRDEVEGGRSADRVPQPRASGEDAAAEGRERA